MVDAMASPVIVAAARTPFGTAGHALAELDVVGLAAPVVARLGEGLDPGQLRDVVLGNARGPGGNLARSVVLAAGLGVDVPAMTVDRQCGSGLAAIDIAVNRLIAGPGYAIGGGVESASTQPWTFWPPVGDAEPVRYDRAPFAPASFGDPDMGEAADLLAAEFGITRDRQDAYAARSHARAVAAAAAGRFAAEIVPLGDVTSDERPRPGLSAARLARFKPVFRAEGTVTAGNSCGVNDGAAAVLLVDGVTHRGLGVPGLRVLASAVTGIDPRRLGLGLVGAVQQVLSATGLGLEQVDVVEFNEAFAGQVLACADALDLAEERVCTDGGALALGHPWGASGAALVVRLFTQLVTQDRGRYGLAALSIGGGQGQALLVERC